MSLSEYPLFLSRGEIIKRVIDVVTLIALPIFLSVAIAYTVHLAPHIAWSSLCGVTAIVLTAQIARFSLFVQKMIRIALHLGPHPESLPPRDEVAYTTGDGVELMGCWTRARGATATAILFHGNAANKEGMRLWQQYYHRKGFNVFMAEYRGYQEGRGVRAGPDQENEAYLDAQAALDFVKRQESIDETKILAHGLSLGGAYAAALGTQHVVLEQTFTSLSAVSAHLVTEFLHQNNLSCLRAPIQLGRWIYVHTAYRSGSNTDTFNTLRKVERMTGEIFVMRAAQDQLMAPHFADELIQANYGGARPERLVEVAGEHCSLAFFYDGAAQAKFDRFLQERGLISGDASH